MKQVSIWRPNLALCGRGPWESQNSQLERSIRPKYAIAAPLNPIGWNPRDPQAEHDSGGSGRSRTAKLEDLSPLARLEAALFLCREVANTRRLATLAGLADATEARTLIQQLNRHYDQRGRSFQVMKVAGGYQLLTRASYSKWIRRLEHIPSVSRLSSPALETLAVVAYRQPIVRAEIDAIRGVGSGELLRQLLERDLVRICGRSEDLGRPFLYATTRQFLKLFGLGSLEELPEAEKLRSPWNSSDQTLAMDEEDGPVEGGFVGRGEDDDLTRDNLTEQSSGE